MRLMNASPAATSIGTRYPSGESRPPMMGPRMKPTPKLAPSIPIQRVRSSSFVTSLM